MEYNIKVELWLASQEITSSRLRSSNTKETTSDGVQKHITKEPLDGSYLNNSDCISSTTVQQEEATLDMHQILGWVYKSLKFTNSL